MDAILIQPLFTFEDLRLIGATGPAVRVDSFDPEQVDPDGRRQIASRYYPAIGPYDSADPVVLEYHCLLMKLAGIDGVIVDWYGQDEYLDLPLRLYRLRRQHATNAMVSAELDRVFTNIVSGETGAAALQLGGVESGRPVIHGTEFTGTSLVFQIGGFLTSESVEVESATNLLQEGWTTVRSFPGSTNAPRYSEPVSAERGPVFLRVRQMVSGSPQGGGIRGQGTGTNR